MQLKDLIKQCKDCSLFIGMNPVAGEGSTNPKLMLLGEAPGETEHDLQRPFVGPAGKELKDILNECDIGPDDAYITNVAKHRPPYNRTPSTEEISICSRKFLVNEIQQLKPKYIVCLGRTALTALHLLQSLPIPQHVRGNEFSYNGTPCISSWHPSYVIRQKAEPFIYKRIRNELKTDIQRAFRC